MTPRSIRRAAERRAKKLARKVPADQTAVTEPRASARGVTAQPTMVAAPISDPHEFQPVTPAQLAANRANAQLSTGPRTAAGRAKSSQNAVKTALTGQTVLLPTDDVEEYASFVAAFQRDLAPVGQAECELVQSIANTHWRQRRILALEFALYAHGHEQFEAAFEDRPEDTRYNMILLQTHLTYEKQFRNFQIQEARLDRKRGRDMAELRRLQEARSAEDANKSPSDGEAQRSSATQRLAAAPLTGNGFDFSNDEFEGLNASLKTPLSSRSLAVCEP